MTPTGTVAAMLEEAHAGAMHAAAIVTSDLQLPADDVDQLAADLDPSIDGRLALPIGVAQLLRNGLAELGQDLGSILADARHGAVIALLAVALDVDAQQLGDGIEAAALATTIPTAHALLDQLARQDAAAREARESEARRAELLKGIRS